MSEPFSVHWDRDVRRWNAPFIMASINTRVVARSAHLLKREPFFYEETHSFPVRTCMDWVGRSPPGGKCQLQLLLLSLPQSNYSTPPP